jgi:hypothetical protein
LKDQQFPAASLDLPVSAGQFFAQCHHRSPGFYLEHGGKVLQAAIQGHFRIFLD